MEIELSRHRRVPSIPFPKEQAITRHFLIFDTETRLVRKKGGLTEHIPFLTCYQHLALNSDGSFTEGKIMYVDTDQDFYEVVERYALTYHELYLIAHNTSYDISALDIFTYFDKYDYKCQVFNPHKGAYFMRFTKPKATIVVIDNMNFFSGSLANLGQELGLAKLSMPKEQRLTKEFIDYCKRDIEIVALGLKELSRICGRYNEGALAITRAKLIFRIYQKNFMNNRILIHNDKDVLDLEFRAYYGGRTEAYFKGAAPKEPYYYLDVNSLYPYCMAGRKFSTRLRFKFQRTEPERVLEAMKVFNIVAEVVVDIDKPYLPLRDRNKVIFPIGTFRTVLAQAELERAIRTGSVRKIVRGAAYHRAEIFTDFVDHFYGLKVRYQKERKPIFTYFAKLCLNSLYGKFGQRVPELRPTGKRSDKRYDITLVYDYKNKRTYHRKVINHVEYTESARQVSTYSVPVIVSEITSLARMRLWDLIERAGASNVFYTDTDSLIVNQAGYENLDQEINNTQIGKLKLEAESQDLTIHGLKDYSFGPRTVLKSVPKKARQIDKDTFEFEYFGTTTDILSQVHGKRMFSKKVRKTMERQVSKGLLLPSQRIIPWRIHRL